MIAKALVLPLISVAFVLSGCGGGDGGGSGGGSTIATGQLKDSNVQGVRFESGTQSGFTSADGSFTYEVGVPVTFSIGGVTLGIVEGKPIIHPVDMVADGSSASVAVQNIVRFLLLLDTDGDADNGIQISAAVRAAAAGWSQVDFTTADLDSALVDIIADVATANASAAALPSVDTAVQHMEASFRCIYSGAYIGRYTGSDEGVFALLVEADTGTIVGLGYSPLEDNFFTLQGSSPLSIDGNADFISGNASTGASFTGSFTSINSVAGTWQNSGGESGSFSGVRNGGARSAIYRFTGLFFGTDAGFFAFDLDANGNVSGLGYTVFEHVTFRLNGSVDGDGNLTASIPGETGFSLSGTLDRSAGTFSGSWSNAVNGFVGNGDFTGVGCKLN